MKLGLVREVFGAQIEEVDDALGAYLRSLDDPHEHYSIIRYHFGFSEDGKRLASGKRMRAIFCILIGRATGAPLDALKTLMLASEVMHGASLVHDDVVDGDSTRWSRPTVWARFGTNQAVNAGDAMIGMTYKLLLQLADEGAPHATVLRVLEIYNRAHMVMSEGQHLDLVHERRPDTSVERYLDIISRKTAMACECPSRASAVLAGCDRAVEGAYATFGHSFGMLYQVVDDFVGVWGDPDDTGKHDLNDIALRKASLPIIYGYARGSDDLKRRLRPIADTSGRIAHLTYSEALEVRRELTDLGVRDLCCNTVRKYRDEAVAALRTTGRRVPETEMLEMMTMLCAKMAGVD